jgi:phage gp16-like protein
MTNAEDLRRRQLAAIHIGKKALHMTDDVYREMLQAVAGVQSAAELDGAGCRAVLYHLRSLGFADGKAKRSHKGRPRNMDQADRGAQLGKVEALLLEANRPWAYADAIALRVCKVERVAWCSPEQLRKVIAALVYNAKREGRRTS